MQITVIGSGNMGSLYGANLARIGQAVALVDVWREHVAAIRERGLQMEGLHGEFTVHPLATTDPAEVPPTDIAIVFVNGYDTGAAAETARAVLKPEGWAITLQNGLGNLETLTKALGEGRVVGGLSFHSADTQAPGRVKHTNHGPTYLGELDRSESGRVRALAGLLDEAGMAPSVEPDILSTIWGKFVHNSAINALSAITGLRPGHFGEVPEVLEFQAAIVEEALALVRARGIRLPDPDPLPAIQAYCAKKFHRVSMLQHLEQGKRTEIDSLNGYIVRESAKLGLATPANTALTALMKGRHHAPRRWPEDGTVY